METIKLNYNLIQELVTMKQVMDTKFSNNNKLLQAKGAVSMMCKLINVFITLIK